MRDNLTLAPEALRDFCERWKVAEFSFFGSVLRADFRPDSDVDVLVNFTSEAQWSLLDLVRMQEELTDWFGRPTSIVEGRGLRNPFRRAEILRTRKILYAA
jgi:predicted nucleotidyltransferase